MFPFAYRRATSTRDAVEMLGQHAEGRLLAGGQTLLPLMKQRLAQPEWLVDIGDLPGFDTIRDLGDELEIGAGARHADVADSALVRATIPALAALAGSIGDAQVRNMGTLGGSLAHADPAADYPAAVLGLDASVVTDRRRIAGRSFFTGMFETALERDEIITAVRFPRAAAAYAKIRNPASGYAMVGAFVTRRDDATAIAITGAAMSVFRSSELERAVAGRCTPAALDGVSVDHGEFNADLHASAEYRGHLVALLAQRALAALIDGRMDRVVQ